MDSTAPATDLRRRLDVLEGEGEDRISLSRRVEVQDDTHVELKLDYGLPLGDRQVDFVVQIYFFFPGSLDVNNLTLPKRYFYNDLQAYLRFKTPDISLEQLLDLEADHSPLARLRALLAERDHDGVDLTDLRDEVVEECKLFGCLVRSYLRDKLERLLKILNHRSRAREGFYDRDRLRSGILRFDGKAGALLDTFRRLHRDFRRPDHELDTVILRAFEQVDEYLSSQYEKTFCRLLERADDVDELLASEIRGAITSRMQKEFDHREREGLLAGPRPDQTNETYTHRMRLLKKFVGSALYLDLRRSLPDKVYSDWIGALAAGLAMLFASLAMFFFDANLQARLDYWVLTLLCVIYIFKDRIKDWVKREMSSDGLGWFPDIDSELRDHRRNICVGRFRETTKWVRPDALPPLVEKIRSFRSMTHRDLRKATGETILRYDKKITLFPRRVQRHHQRRGDLNDIIRLGFERFRRHMDVPEANMRTLDPSTGKVLHATGRKTYSINLIIRYSTDVGEPRYEKVRVVLDKQGLERVETVIPPCSRADLSRLDRDRAVEEWIRATYLWN